jgi:hypothetical protein
LGCVGNVYPRALVQRVHRLPGHREPGEASAGARGADVGGALGKLVRTWALPARAPCSPAPLGLEAPKASSQTLELLGFVEPPNPRIVGPETLELKTWQAAGLYREALGSDAQVLRMATDNGSE